jgi:hypothetical protein
MEAKTGEDTGEKISLAAGLGGEDCMDSVGLNGSENSLEVGLGSAKEMGKRCVGAGEGISGDAGWISGLAGWSVRGTTRSGGGRWMILSDGRSKAPWR